VIDQLGAARDWIKACHEAAHAVIGRHLGLRIRSATIEASETALALVTFDGYLEPEEKIIFILAGHIGDILGSAEPDEYPKLLEETAGRAEFSTDERHAREEALLLAEPEFVEEYLNTLRQRTLQLVIEEWPAIGELAKRLVVERTVQW
jgi:hypothetical protein